MTNRTDNFNRADSTSTLGTPSDSGSAWTAASGTWGIVSNAGYKELTNLFNQAAWLEASVADVSVQVTLSGSTVAAGGLICRLADDGNYIMAQWDAGTTLYLFRKVAGSYVQIGPTYSGTLTSGDVMKLECDSANLISISQNTVLRISATSSAGATNTKHGIECYHGGTSLSLRFDDFSITALGGVSGKPYLYSKMMGA